MIFNRDYINLSVLKNRAYNLRWATVPDDVIPLTAADPDFQCSPAIINAVEAYSREGYFSYTPPEGLPEFKLAMHDFLKSSRSWSVDPKNILPVDSAAFGIYLTCQTFLNPGDEAIIFDPVDFLFHYSITEVGAIPVRFAIPPGTANVDFSELERLVTPQTKMICLCNPLNPTGKVFTRKELEQLGDVALRHNLLILSDEIWSDIIFQPAIFTSIGSLSEELSNNVILVSGFSKSYGLAGLRIGVVAATNSVLFEQLLNRSLHRSTIHGANSIGQIAATAALEKSQQWLKEFVEHLQNMRDLVTERINQIPGLSTVSPDGCYVSFIDVRGTGMTAEAFQLSMFEDAKVALVPGLSQWFGPGAEGYVRLSFATSFEILNEALNRIERNL
jgi:aspartate/methionine/tyrosine aminotransferase